eukprot:TRINITY_DN3875_c0_g1_i15.p1 TRINITY_DN3875_c0_g1~~TRINITY_DN3875_c0_g1_i15.p1  ORF type:complete len:563 (+),score=91.38 TRINITY_DN3875_c0_g1_i15:368-2056(+)
MGLTFNQPVSDFPITETFKYYVTPQVSNIVNSVIISLGVINNPSPGTNRDVIQTASFYLFVKTNGLPTLTDYDYLMKDTTASPLTIFKPEGISGNFYGIGVWGGAVLSNYTLNVQAKASCPNSCSQHGTCINGRCSCFDGWNLSDCSLYEKRISDEEALYENITEGSWKFYKIMQITTSDIVFYVRPQIDEGTQFHLSLYANPNVRPNETHYYQFQNFTTHDLQLSGGFKGYLNMTLVDIESHGIWYLGLRLTYSSVPITPTQPFTYIIQPASTNLCPNNCNGGIGCNSDGSCSCASDHVGVDCSTFVQKLVFDDRIQTAIQDLGPNTWNYFQIDVPHPISYFVVNLTVTKSLPVSIYINRGTCPSAMFYESMLDHRAIDKERPAPFVESLAINTENPIPATTWYIGVLTSNETTGTDFGFVVFLGNNCVDPKECTCKANKLGNLCQYPYDPIPLNQVVVGQIQSLQWTFYHFALEYDSPLTIIVTELYSQNSQLDYFGLLRVYVSGGSIPNAFDATYSDRKLQQTHTIHIQHSASRANWTVGVAASPLLFNSYTNYQIIGW